MAASKARVGDWQLVGKLGQGGFGEVLHWRNQSTNQEIATKHINKAEQMGADQQLKLKTRWTQEYKFTRQFQNLKNIVAGVELGSDSKEFVDYLNSNHVWQLPVIILEYCNGGDVRKLLQAKHNVNGLVEFEVRAILNCLRQAIDFLHNQCGICHRDLKPDNIVINRLPNGSKLYKLTDFGLARDSPDKTILQSVVGTRHYYAPEVVDTGKYNVKVDYWSMGIIGYELATGVLPFIPHQTAFNIHQNLRYKQRNCVAITEDFTEPNRFHNHVNIPLKHHLSGPFEAEFTKFLTMALDRDYNKRGNSVAATDEVQGSLKSPAIFSAIDRLVEMNVLTLFVASKYQRLEYVVRPGMTMPELAALITRDTGFQPNVLYLLLPTGHPHKQVTLQTTPMDLYVPNWCDTSENSRNPPVMVYVFNTHLQCEYTAPDPCITELIKHCINSGHTKHPKWMEDRMVLDYHYMLSKELSSMQTMLFGFKEYAMTLEHDIICCQPIMKALDSKKDKCCGAMEQFNALITAAKQKHKVLNNEVWEEDWLKLGPKCNETVKLIEKTVEHFESTLRNTRDAVKQSMEIYKEFIETDKFKIKDFRRNFIARGDHLTCKRLSELVIEASVHTRNSLLNDENLRFMRSAIHQAQSRFMAIKATLPTAHQGLNDIGNQLLHLQLQMLPSVSSVSMPNQPSIYELDNDMNQLHLDAGNEQPSSSLNAFDSLDTMKSINQALLIRQLLEDDMET